MNERYPGYLFGGTPISSWDRTYTSLESLRPRALYHKHAVDDQYLNRQAAASRRWGSMSDGGGVSGGGGDASKTNLIVNYLPQTMTEKDLYAMFMTIGPIESCRVMKDFKTGYSYGFGFVNFAREEDALRAIDTFNGYQLRNKRLKVSYARPSGEEIKDTNLYVTNLPRGISEDLLETIFGKYGRIVQKHILRDKSNGTPRGVAFVRYDKREEAQEAIAALNNVIPEGGTEPLCVKPMSGESHLKRGSSLSRARHHTHHYHDQSMVAEEHGKQKAAYYAGFAAGFHHNREDDYDWGCGGCLVPDPWDRLPPLSGSHPNTPRNGFCPNGRGYPVFPHHKGGQPLARQPRGGRHPPWPGYQDERFRGQRCRPGPTPYW